MSYQYEVSGTITLNPRGVEVITAFQAAHVAAVAWWDAGQIGEEPEETWAIVARQFPEVSEYAANDRSGFIPFGVYGDLDPESVLEGNVWSISCSTSNHDGEIEDFLFLLPALAIAVDLNVENDDGITVRYKLMKGEVIECSRKGRYDDDCSW